MRKTILALLLVVFTGIAFAPVAHARQDEEDSKELKLGKRAKGIVEAEFVNGTEFKDFAKGKVYVVDIWSSASPLCKRSIPYLNQLQQERGPKGLVVVGLTQDKKSAVKDYMKDKASSMSYSVAVMKKDAGDGEMWMKAAKAGALPFTTIVNRAGLVCYLGSPLDDKFEKILMLVLADRYDPELKDRAEPTIAAARRAAKLRNYREATRLYEQVVELSPKQFANMALEHWRMLSEQALDPAAAKAYLRKYIDKINADEPTLTFVGEYLATNTELKNRDLEAATIIGDLLKKKATTDAEALAAIAAIQAANGDFQLAAETQHDAWMSAVPSTKAAFKRRLDLYRAGKQISPTDAATTSGAGAPAETPKAPAGTPAEQPK